jgi:hypothetical protein
MKRSTSLIALSMGLSLGYARPLRAGLTAYEGHFSAVIDARTSALGGTRAALPNDRFAGTNNPASLGPLNETGIYFSQEALIEDVSANSFLLNITSARGGFSAAHRALNYGQTPRLDSQGQPDGSFIGQDVMNAFGYGFSSGRYFSFGVKATQVESNIDNFSASAWCGSLGLLARSATQRFWLGLTVDNAITTGNFSFDSEKENIPVVLRGGSWFFPTVSQKWSVGIDYAKVGPNISESSVGSELVVLKTDALGLIARGGYHLQKKSLGGNSGISGGLGFRWKSLQLDWAWSSLGDFGLNQVVSLSYKLSSPVPVEKETSRSQDSARDAPAPSDSAESTNTFYLEDGRVIRGHVFTQDDKQIGVENGDHWSLVPLDQIEYKK